MLHLEFALAPCQINSLSDLTILEAQFGFEKGALLSLFPNSWCQEVLQKLTADLDGTKLDRATEKIRRIKENKLVSFGRLYVGNNWGDAAQTSHAEKPFHRAIYDGFTLPPELISNLEDLNEHDFSFLTQYERTSATLANAAKALLSSAEKVTIYDPFICITKRGYRNTLQEMMSLCQKNEIEFHIFSEEDRKPAWGNCLTELQRFVDRMPRNIKLFWYCAADDNSGFLHSRGLFTSKGGLTYDRGFCEPGDRDQRNILTDITPMPLHLLEQKSRSYNSGLQYEDFRLVREVWKSHPS